MPMRYFKRKYVQKPGYWRDHWDRALTACLDRLATIWDRLPESARQLETHAKRYPLHDAGLEAVTVPAPQALRLDLGCRALEFRGVVEQEMTPPFAAGDSDVWLYDELELAGAGEFELRVLFEERDFRVVAREVHVLSLKH